ncbi:MAG: AraC family transcriptional regulator, partial [Lachnospiraceae bacterium]
CLYSHHFYEIDSIKEKLDVIYVKFYIGLFMYMSWEKHPKNANAKLVYDTKAIVQLREKDNSKIKQLFLELLEEKQQQRFESKNLIEYKTLELHAYFCRFAYEEIGFSPENESEIWTVIKKVVLTTGKNLSLKEIAQELNLTESKLNRMIKEACGYTFFQLQQAGKVLNSCALLHFPELSMNYISDLLGFSSVTMFYRIFQQFCKMSPREYQKENIGGDEFVLVNSSMAMQFLQYMHLNFMQDLTLEELCKVCYVKPYQAKQIFTKAFGMNFNHLLTEIRISYAAAFLQTGKCSAVDTAALCGFDSYTTFQRKFKLYMKQTPSEYCQICNN